MKRKHPGRQRRLDESKIEMRAIAAVKVLEDEPPRGRFPPTFSAEEARKFQEAWNADYGTVIDKLLDKKDPTPR